MSIELNEINTNNLFHNLKAKQHVKDIIIKTDKSLFFPSYRNKTFSLWIKVIISLNTKKWGFRSQARFVLKSCLKFRCKKGARFKNVRVQWRMINHSVVTVCTLTHFRPSTQKSNTNLNNIFYMNIKFEEMLSEIDNVLQKGEFKGQPKI